MSSIQLVCPNCSASIDPADVNVSIDLAKCGNCNNMFKVSELVPNGEESERVTELPKDSLIRVERAIGNATEIILPAMGFQPTDLFMIIFGTFWVGFLVVWTSFAAFASVYFALFSIPFWIAGIFIWMGVVRNITEVEIVRIDHASITVVKKRPIFIKQKQFALGRIDAVKLTSPIAQHIQHPFRSSNYVIGRERFSGPKGAQEPAIVSGNETVYFFARATTAEKQWIVYFLDTLVEKYK